MGLITNGLAETKTSVVATEFQWFLLVRKKQDLFLLCQRHDLRRLHIERRKDLKSCVQLSSPTIKQDHVGIEFHSLPSLAIST